MAIANSIGEATTYTMVDIHHKWRLRQRQKQFAGDGGGLVEMVVVEAVHCSLGFEQSLFISLMQSRPDP